MHLAETRFPAGGKAPSKDTLAMPCSEPTQPFHNLREGGRTTFAKRDRASSQDTFSTPPKSQGLYKLSGGPAPCKGTLAKPCSDPTQPFRNLREGGL